MNKCLNYSCPEIKYGTCCADFTTFHYIVADICYTDLYLNRRRREKMTNIIYLPPCSTELGENI
jgi:hypothetical protein